MRKWLVMMALVFLFAGLTACGDSKEAEPDVQVKGPALVMFFTDN